MRLASLIASAVGILVLLSASGVSAQSAAEEPRSGWYVGGGIGATWPSNLAQSGWNRDPICYPTDACFDQDPRPEISGYRWHYDIAAATGPVFELSTGLFVDRARVGAVVQAEVERPRSDVPQRHQLRGGGHGGSGQQHGHV